MVAAHLFLQKRGVDWKTGPEVSQQLASCCIKVFQLALDIIRDHFWKVERKKKIEMDNLRLLKQDAK